MENLTYLKNNLILEQSEIFGEFYEEINIKNNNIKTFNEVSINDVEAWYNSIENKYYFLNEIQITNLQIFFLNLKDKVLKNIDPNKLNINNCKVDDSDLLLWRESYLGISKLVFDELGQIVYMFNGNDGKMIKGVFNNSVDMEKLLYRFISK